MHSHAGRRSALAGVLLASVWAFSACTGSNLPSKSHVSRPNGYALTGRLIPFPSPSGPQLPGTVSIEFEGHWTNKGPRTIFLPSNAPTLLKVGESTWQSGAVPSSRHCTAITSGKNLILCAQARSIGPHTVSTVPLQPGIVVRWVATFTVPNRLCGKVATIRIRGLPGSVQSKIPCLPQP